MQESPLTSTEKSNNHIFVYIEADVPEINDMNSNKKIRTRSIIINEIH